jgi:hypothetical protein
MRQALKKYFIPHADNDYHPHILHGKRAIFYSAFFVSLKIILFIFALALPSTVFVLRTASVANRRFNQSGPTRT